MANVSAEGSNWGRVLICGGTDWATNGRKERSSGKVPTDLMEPHILRSLCNVKASKIITGPSANYAIILDIHGAAYLFGRPPAMVQSNGVISENIPLKISPLSVGSPEGTKWVNGAAGRSHFLLVDSRGDVWGCGNNIVGQIGVPVATVVDKLTKVAGPWVGDPEAKIVQATAGHTFSLFLTSTGQVYASGSSEFGQLGNGKTGERLVKAGKIAYDIEVPPRLVQGFENVKIIEIASGNQHSLALDDNGYVYSWGFAGYSRLGLQDQKDRLISPLAGSTGQPYTRFKHIQDVMSCKVIKTSSGGCTHFITTPDPEGGVMTVGFGQGVLYGELGLGSDSAKSATKPQKIIPLSGVDMIDVAGGAFFTLFLARPNSALSDLDRYPIHINSASLCLVCNTDHEQDAPLECERCDQPYHIGCLSPPLSAVPEGEWFCPECALEADAGPDELFKPALGITIPKVVNGKKGLKQDAVEAGSNPEAPRSTTDAALTPSKSVSGSKRSWEEEKSAQGSGKKPRKSKG
ncbi:hypothetical protein I314_03480 [Cryptococcus bacillisporus CA1873]|uniref:PHD-type domain-containing protein n=1 Tax=Cryptococcus bacillisporus CA1873 TaxID=1296111 RepID=A0ABR5BAX5_CRYGA|nr:hypothetical protein I314_03480 [Cryptococcus bacillisporus CA1873]|eukprot:KIR62535.1 hypothetical protein I314_03480 [Cryptococcus gattii CA1873]